MTTYTQARDNLVTLINTSFSAAYPTMKVFYENTVEVDVNTVGDMFVKVAIDMLDAVQVTIETQPKRRVYGEITLQFMYKEGKGTRDALGLFDYVDALLSMKQLSGIVTRVTTPGRKLTKSGWAEFSLHVPFMFDSTA
jgi:hypothetical protein